jgi:hypothetical protein
MWGTQGSHLHIEKARPLDGCVGKRIAQNESSIFPVKECADLRERGSTGIFCSTAPGRYAPVK